MREEESKLLSHLIRKKLLEQVIEPTGDDDNVGGSNWDDPDPIFDYGNVWGDDIELTGNADDFISINPIIPDENYIPDEFDNNLIIPNPNLTYDPTDPQGYNMNCVDYGCMDPQAYNYNSNAGPFPWCGTHCHYDAPISFYNQDYNDESYHCAAMSSEVGGNFHACYVLDGFTYTPGFGMSSAINNYQVQCCQTGTQVCTLGQGCVGMIDPQQIEIVQINPPDAVSCTPENSGCRHPQWANFSPNNVCDCDGNFIGEWAGPGSFAGNTDCCSNDRCNTGQGPLWPESTACKPGDTPDGYGQFDGSWEGHFSGTGCLDPEAMNYCQQCLNQDNSQCIYRDFGEHGETGWEDDNEPDIVVHGPDTEEIPDTHDGEDFEVTIDRVMPDPPQETPRKTEKKKDKEEEPKEKEEKKEKDKEKLNEAKKCKIGKKCGGPDCHGCTWTWMFNKCTCSYGGMTPAGTNEWEKSISNDVPNIVKDKLREEFTRMKTIWKYKI